MYDDVDDNNKTGYQAVWPGLNPGSGNLFSIPSNNKKVYLRYDSRRDVIEETVSRV